METRPQILQRQIDDGLFVGRNFNAILSDHPSCATGPGLHHVGPRHDALSVESVAVCVGCPRGESVPLADLHPCVADRRPRTQAGDPAPQAWIAVKVWGYDLAQPDVQPLIAIDKDQISQVIHALVRPGRPGQPVASLLTIGIGDDYIEADALAGTDLDAGVRCGIRKGNGPFIHGELTQVRVRPSHAREPRVPL